MDILNKLAKEKHNNNFIVDIGSSFNSHFINYPFRGGLFDMDLNKINRLPTNNLYTKICKKITPDNVISSLEEINTPENFLALNLDIDGYDLFVLIELLKKYSPKVIITEVNEKMPYPLDFAVLYNENYKWTLPHLYGYSLNCLSYVMEHFNYKLENFIFNNAILVKEDAKDIEMPVIYKQECNKWIGKGGWNKDVEYWQELKGEDLENEIKSFFKDRNDDFVIGEHCKNVIMKQINL